MTANWKNDSGHQWTVPVGGGVGKLFRTSKDASDWQLRFQMQFLLPKF